MENELQQLSKQKEACLVEVEKLKAEERSSRIQLSDLNGQIEGQHNNALARGANKPDAKNSSSSARNGQHVEVSPKEPNGKQERDKLHPSNGTALVGKGKAKKPIHDETTEDGDESESEEEVGVDMTAGSMDLAELGQPLLKPKVCTLSRIL